MVDQRKEEKGKGRERDWSAWDNLQAPASYLPPCYLGLKIGPLINRVSVRGQTFPTQPIACLPCPLSGLPNQPTYLPTHKPIHLTAYLPTFVCIFPSIILTVSLSAYLPIYLPTFLLDYFPIYYLSLSVCNFIFPIALAHLHHFI